MSKLDLREFEGDFRCVDPKYAHLAGQPVDLMLAGIADQYRRDQISKESIVMQQCACKKMKPVSQMPIYNTGHMHAIDNVCVGCKKDFENFARIVCRNCKAPVLFVSAHKDNDGFVFVAGKTYHVTCCPGCNDQAKFVIPVEKIVFDYQKRGSNVPLKDFARSVWNLIL